MSDADSRPTFDELDQEFSKMARDPKRYIVIDEEQLKCSPHPLKVKSDFMASNICSDIDKDNEYEDKEFIGKSLYQLGNNKV